MDPAALRLEKLGLSHYEARVFIALVRSHPMNGYEASKLSRVPASKIYETLDSLRQKGVITAEEGVRPVRYCPIPPAELAVKLKAEYASAIDELEAELALIRPTPDLDLTWNLKGYDAVLARMTEVIRGSTRSLMASLWPEELALLEGEFAVARARGVVVVLGVFGDPGGAGTYSVNLEGCGEFSLVRLGRKLTVVVADSREVVMSGIDGKGSVGVWTSTPDVVLVAKEYIRHDIWGRMLIDRLGEDEFRKLCEESELLSLLIHVK